MNLSQARSIAGSLGFPSKMPGTSYGLPASACIVGSKLAAVAGSVCHGCYALKGNYNRTNVMKAMRRRLEGIRDPRWVDAMVRLLLQKHSKPQFRIDLGKVRAGEQRWRLNVAGWHRWHDSGDLQGVWHLKKICEVAMVTPEIRHWLATREAKIVRDYVDGGGLVPANLVIRVSATMVDGAPPKSWSHTSTVHSGKLDVVGQACPAPTQGNFCGSCRACWSPDIANISYHLH